MKIIHTATHHPGHRIFIHRWTADIPPPAKRDYFEFATSEEFLPLDVHTHAERELLTFMERQP